MSRYISQLPEPIKALAEKRRSEQLDYYQKEDVLPRAFDWNVTEEGFDFWNQINKSNYSIFYDLYPQKEKLDELIEWITLEIASIIKSDANLTVINTYETILNKAKEIKQTNRVYGKSRN